MIRGYAGVIHLFYNFIEEVVIRIGFAGFFVSSLEHVVSQGVGAIAADLLIKVFVHCDSL